MSRILKSPYHNRIIIKVPNVTDVSDHNSYQIGPQNGDRSGQGKSELSEYHAIEESTGPFLKEKC